MSGSQGYWVVSLEAFAFESREDAISFRDAITDAFCAMPEAEGYGSATDIRFEPDDAARTGTDGEC